MKRETGKNIKNKAPNFKKKVEEAVGSEKKVEIEEKKIGNEKAGVVIGNVKLSDEEKDKFGIIADEGKSNKIKHSKTHSQEMKKRIKKEKRIESRINKKSWLIRTFSNLSFYKSIFTFFDFILNAASLVALVISVYYTIFYFIEKNPIMVIVGCLVIWFMMKLNKEIQ